MTSPFEMGWSAGEPLAALTLARSWTTAHALTPAGETIPELARQVHTAAEYERHTERVGLAEQTRRSFAQAGQASMTCVVGGGPWACWIRRIQYFRMLAQEADRVLGPDRAAEFWNHADAELAGAPRSLAPWRWMLVRKLATAVRAREGLRLLGGGLRHGDPAARFAERRTGSDNDRPAEPRAPATDRRERSPRDRGLPEIDDDGKAPPVEDLGL